jgi:hypothetical protein
MGNSKCQTAPGETSNEYSQAYASFESMSGGKIKKRRRKSKPKKKKTKRRRRVKRKTRRYHY